MQTEDREYAAFMRRAVRAFVRRAGNDPEALRMLVDLGRYVDESVAEGIKGAHNTGYSYGEIAARLGISRQAVHHGEGFAVVPRD